MRPFHEYPTLDLPQLAAELANTVKLLYGSYGEYAKALADYEREHLSAYYAADEDSHAARTRFADYQTRSLHDDVTTFEQNIAAYKVLYDFLTNLIQWRINGNQAPRIQRGTEADHEELRGVEGRSGSHPSLVVS